MTTFVLFPLLCSSENTWNYPILGTLLFHLNLWKNTEGKPHITRNIRPFFLLFFFSFGERKWYSRHFEMFVLCRADKDNFRARYEKRLGSDT